MKTEKSETAVKYFLEGANCAQAVLCAFAGECGISVDFAMRLASGFGAGIARRREVCGAVSGMIMAADLLFYDPLSADRKKAKDAQYALIRELTDTFEREAGSLICRELLQGISVTSGTVSEERTAEYYSKRPCAAKVALAASILAEKLLSRPNPPAV